MAPGAPLEAAAAKARHLGLAPPAAAPERLRTDRLLLERWRDRHADRFLRLAADARVTRSIGRGTPWTAGEAAATFNAALEHWRLHGFGWRAIVEAASGRWLGVAGLNVVGAGTAGVDPREVEIGWWLEPAAWGRGYASEAGKALRDEAFERLRLARIVARCRLANVASARVMQRIGMRPAFDTCGRHGEALHVYELDRAGWSERRAGEPARSGRRA